jgi:hypothetical protein
MTELIIYAIIVLLAVALSVYRVMTISDEQPNAVYDEYWWMALPM